MKRAYNGGKGGPGVYQALINQMPPHGMYVEPFAGGGAVFRHKRPAAKNVAIDTNGAALAVLASAVRDDGAAGSSPAALQASIDYEFVEGCGVSWLQAAVLPADALVYADPPYLMAVRVGARLYYGAEHEPGRAGRAVDEAWHVGLLATLRSLECMVMVSGYWSGLYADLLADWRVVTYTAVNRAGEQVLEYCWCNFPGAEELHDYAFLGADYRERERIRRKVGRWRERYLAMDVLERRAILAALQDADGGLDGR